jgi:hypothetical protein
MVGGIIITDAEIYPVTIALAPTIVDERRHSHLLLAFSQNDFRLDFSLCF